MTQPTQPTERVLFESANGKVIFNGDVYRIVKRDPHHMTTLSDVMLIEDMAREIERLRLACATQNYSIEQTLGKALGYPRYGDLAGPSGDREADDDVCTGEHIAETLAMEAVKEIERLRAMVDQHSRNLDSGTAFAATVLIDDLNNEIAMLKAENKRLHTRLKNAILPNPGGDGE